MSRSKEILEKLKPLPEKKKFSKKDIQNILDELEQQAIELETLTATVPPGEMTIAVLDSLKAVNKQMSDIENKLKKYK